jgi:hypothetical protein
MKGYTRVGVEKAMSARSAYLKWEQDTKKLVEQKIVEYRDQEYPKLWVVSRWLRKNQTPKQFLLDDLKMFDDYSDKLYKVCTGEECSQIYKWCWCSSTNAISATIRKLCNASSDGWILVDQDIAGFIEEYA